MNIDQLKERNKETIEDLKEYTRTNGHEMYKFFMANLDSLESVSNMLVMYWDDLPDVVKHQIENELNREPYDEAVRRIYG